MALVIWFVSAVIAMFGAICYIELGTAIRRSGADFAYLSYVKWFVIFIYDKHSKNCQRLFFKAF